MKIGTAGSIVLTEEQKQELAELGHALFACPELGFKEVKSSGILTSFLIKEGFSVETGFIIYECGSCHIKISILLAIGY